MDIRSGNGGMCCQGVMPATVVITGGIGSGKSMVCGMLARKGLPTYDSDSAAKRLYDLDDELLEAVVGHFGTEVLGADGRIDRRELARRVFSDSSELKILEDLVHPAVFRDFEKWKSQQTSAFVVYESALALQHPLPDGFADEIVLVDAPLELRLERACRRDGRSREETEARARQQNADATDPRLTYILENNGTEAELTEKVDAMYHIFIEKFK